MKNIKIAPYPNRQITQECIDRDIIPNSVKPDGSKLNVVNFNTPNVLIAQFTDGAQRVIRTGPIVPVGNEKYFSVFPNPVHLYLDFSIKCFNDSETIKQTSFPVCAKKTNKKVDNAYLLDVDADETHNCYNEFFKLRMTSIIMLTTSVEAFINHSIPNDYPDKNNIERNGKFKDKLTTDLPQSLKLNDFWSDKDGLRCSLINLNNLRNDLVHLKTNSDEDFNVYFNEINKMLKFNILKAINDVITFMNLITPDFIKKIE
ncbi:MAG: hypothetical protein JNJ40_19670 [Bacteroidia bacterium]|nr:hypothetical protein [Bacteroidia bacterium]